MTQEAPGTERQPRAIRKITEADRVRVVDMLARAFDDDPPINHVVRQDGRRAEAITAMMDMALAKMTLPFGETYMTEDGAGAGLWNAPGQRPHGLAFELSLVPAFLRITGPKGFRRGMATMDLMEKNHPKEAHFYLMVLGVDPSEQGKGTGSSLLAPMAERLDAEGMPAYLESSKERNLPLYERFGFKVTQVNHLPDGDRRSGRCGASRVRTARSRRRHPAARRR